MLLQAIAQFLSLLYTAYSKDLMKSYVSLTAVFTWFSWTEAR